MLMHRQRRWIQALAGIGVLLILLATVGGLALADGGYELFGRVAGGGDTTGTGGTYALQGTLGQHEATGERTGGPYAVYGGWWSPSTSGPTAVTLAHLAGRTVGKPAIAVPLALGMLSALGLLLLQRRP